MKINKLNRLTATASVATIALAGMLSPSAANAATLSAASGIGTFTMSMDENAFAQFQGGPGGSPSKPGMFNDHFYNTAASNPTVYTGSALNLLGDNTPESSNSLVHDITPTGPNPTGQQAGRGVKGTTANFAIDSVTLTTPTSSLLGMTGIQELGIGGSGPFAGSSIVSGDYALRYNPALRQSAWDDAGFSGTATGWYLFNGLDIPTPAYDLENLSVTVTDSNNWRFSGDLLLGPELAAFYGGAAKTDVGNFCLGVGSFSGCNVPVSSVPVPAAVWLFGTGLMGFVAGNRRKLRFFA